MRKKIIHNVFICLFLLSMKENMGMNANTYSINYQPKIMNVNCDSIFVEI